MPLDKSFGAMSKREITIISLESADKLVLGAPLQHVLLESHPEASSCYFSSVLELGDCRELNLSLGFKQIREGMPFWSR